MKEQFTEFDEQRIRSALENVNVANGLAERIRGRLRAEVANSGAESKPPAEPLQADGTLAQPHSRLAAEPLLLRPDVPTQSGASDPTQLAGAASAVEAAGLSSHPRRRSWLGLVVAACLAGLLVGVYQFTRPYSQDYLADYCTGQLERTLASQANWQTPDQESLQALQVLRGQVKFQNVRVVGYLDQADHPFADSCRMWALHSGTANREFYVMDFSGAESIEQLSRQLQNIKQRSGGWTLVALQQDQRLVVVAFQGPRDSYLQPIQSA